MKKLPRLKRSIKPHERIEVFSEKNKKTDFREDRGRVLKVYDTKKRKYVGTFNDTDKRGRPIPKLFGRVQFRMYHLFRAPKFSPPVGKGIKWTVDPKKYIKFQIPKRVVDHVLKNAIHQGKSFQVQIHVKIKGGQVEKHTRNPAYLLTKGNTADDIRKIITNEAICAAVGNNLRFSSIALARGHNKIKRQIKSATIRITYNTAPKGVIRVKKSDADSKTRKMATKKRSNKRSKKGSKGNTR